MSGRAHLKKRFRFFFSWLFGRGGMKRAILAPFVSLLVVAFAATWRLHVDGSRSALVSMIEGLARGGASRVESELRAFLSVPDTAATMVALRFSEASAHYSGPLQPIDSLPFALAVQLASFPTLDILAVGFENGEYAEAQRQPDGSIRYGLAGASTGGDLVLFTRRADGSLDVQQRSSGYDPRRRPWYRDAAGKEGVVWSEPYAYVSTGLPAVAAGRAFVDAESGALRGVVSATVGLSSLSAFLSSMEELKGGAAAILDARGLLLAVSLPDGAASVQLLSPATEMSGPHSTLFSAAAGAERSTLVRMGGERWRVVERPVRDSRLSWTVLAALPESRHLSALFAAERRVGVIFVLAFLAAVCVAFLIAYSIAEPLRLLGSAALAFASEIDHSAAPRVPDARELSRMAARADELGHLAASFSTLRSRLTDSFNRLNSSVAEKDVLLKEVHHRVKNNLQIVSSLMSLQESESEDPAFVSAMGALQDRVRAMAVVHETIYSSGDFVSVHMDDYFSRLISSLSSYPRSGARISLDVVPGEALLPLEQAIPCGLIAVELTTNAIKHAFEGRAEGRITISLSAAEDSFLLAVEDDGVGYGASDGKVGKGMGSLIVEALAAQLRGSVSVHLPESSGTRVEVVFPIQPV